MEPCNGCLFHNTDRACVPAERRAVVFTWWLDAHTFLRGRWTGQPVARTCPGRMNRPVKKDSP